MNFLSLVESKVLAFIFSVLDKRSPMKTKVAAIIGLLYVLSPFDLVPDFIPFAGWLDDIILVPFGLSLVSNYIPQDVWQDAMARAEKIVKRIKYSLLAGLIVIVLLLGFIAYQIAK